MTPKTPPEYTGKPQTGNNEVFNPYLCEMPYLLFYPDKLKEIKQIKEIEHHK